MQQNYKRATEIFLVLMKIGFFTYGGGWSVLAQLEKEFVDKRGWLTQQDLLDYMSFGKSLPGVMIINISVLFGYHAGGVICAFAAAFGIAFPALVTLSIVTYFYNSIHDNALIEKALVGVRAAVIPIIWGATVRMRKSAFVDNIGYGIAILAFLLFLFTDLNNIIIVILGAAAGLLIMGGKQHELH